MTTPKPLWLAVALACGGAACASNQKQVYGGTELEGKETSDDDGSLKMNGVAGGVNSVGATRDQSDLALSFEPEPSHDDADSDPEGDDTPPPAHVTTQRDTKEAAFEEKRQKALKLAAGGKGQEAQDLGKELETLALDGLPPWRYSHALEVQARAWLALRDAESTRKTAEAWLLSCGPDKPDGCRARALYVLGRAAALGKMPTLKARVEKLNEHDRCVRKAEGGAGRAQGEPPECLNDALGAYRAGKDLLMQLRVYYARGVALSGKEDKRGQAIYAFQKAEAHCSEPRCVAWRRKALKRLSQLYAADGDLQRSAECALAEAHLYASTLPDEVKLWAMTPQAILACDKLDTKAGAGTCRKFEKAKYGSLLFIDYSQQKTRSGALTTDDVKKVNAHYAVLLEQCLEAEKSRMAPLSAYKYQVRWLVTNEGAVTKIEFGGDGRENSPLGQCVKDQFANWRYPRYAGEFQHVEQSFMVSTRTRR